MTRIPSCHTLLCTLMLAFAHGLAPAQPSAPALEWELRGSTEIKAAWFFSICRMELYTERGMELRDEDPLLLPERALALEITYHRSISATRLVSLAEKGLLNQYSAAELEPFRPSIDAFNAAYEDVSDGDIYRLEHVPGGGLILYRNGSEVHREGDPLFALHYLSIWLGEHDSARKLRAALLSEST